MQSGRITPLEQALHSYWTRRGQTYYVPDVFGRRIITSYIQKLKPQSLIEVGCGNGELFNGFKDVPRVIGLDFSQSMLDRAKERIERHGYTNITLFKADITKDNELLPLWLKRPEDAPKPFDLAITRTVLMHITPATVENACINLTLMSDQLLLMEFYDPTFEPEKLDWHNFHHEYVQIFKRHNYELVDSYDRPDGLPQILFHFVKVTKNGR